MDVDEDTLLRLIRRAESVTRATSFTVSYQTYRALWDFHDGCGERPWAYRFHALARRRFARELAACLR